jgi:hypothetical protein
MPSQPARGRPSSGPATGYATFSPEEWELLVRLPGQVVIAATSAEADGSRRTVAEGLAGLDALAAGRSSPNALVRNVVATIYAERDDAQPAAEEFVDRAAGLAAVLMSCHRAAGLLAERSPDEDRAAYRAWLQSIAERVCGAATSGGVLGFGGDRISAAEAQFLDDLSRAFTR